MIYPPRQQQQQQNQKQKQFVEKELLAIYSIEQAAEPTPELRLGSMQRVEEVT